MSQYKKTIIKPLFIIIILLNSTIIWAAECYQKSKIDNCKTVQELLNMTNHPDGLKSECYYYIGEKLYKLYLKNKKKKILTEAQKIFKHAVANLSRIYNRTEYKMCNAYLVIIECLIDKGQMEDVIHYYNNINDRHLIKQNDIHQLVTQKIDRYLSYYNKADVNEEPPQSIIEFIKKLNINTAQTKKFKIKQKKKEYEKLHSLYIANLLKIQKEPVYDDIKTQVRLLKEMEEYRSVFPVPDTLNGFERWMQYFEIVMDVSGNAAEQCMKLNTAEMYFNEVKQQFSYAKETQDIECRISLACLSREIQVEKDKLLPKPKDTNYSKKFDRCNLLFNEYTSVLKHCPKKFIIEDNRPFLKKVLAYYKAFDQLKNKGQISDLVIEFSKSDEPELKESAGYHIADYYHQKAAQQLLKGPGNKEPLVVLRHIRSMISKYQPFSGYREKSKDELNVIIQHQRLTKFFSNVDANTKNNQLKIHPSLKQIWQVKKYINEQIAIQAQRNREYLVSSTTSKKTAFNTASSFESTDSNKALNNAIRSFNTFEYLDAWNSYQMAYPNIVPDRIDDLINQNESLLSHTPNNVWNLINQAHKCRLKLLTYIIKMKNEDVSNAYFANVFAQKRNYDENISWHFAEQNHSIAEKNSDMNFFKGFAYILNQNNIAEKKAFIYFLRAWLTLDNSKNHFNKKAYKRISNKINRIKYWLKKIWNQYDHSIKNELKIKYYKDHKKIFDNDLLVKRIRLTQAIIQTNHPEPLYAFARFANYLNDYPEKGINCNMLRTYCSNIEGDKVDDCLDSFKTIASRYKDDPDNELQKDELNKRIYIFYFALAQIRKYQNKINDWVENLVFSYNRANDDQKELICKECCKAKNRCLKTRCKLTKKVRHKLERCKLYNYWKDDSLCISFQKKFGKKP